MSRPWKNSIVSRILLPYLGVLLLLAGFFYTYSESAIKDFYLSTTLQGLEREIRLAGRLIPWGVQGPALDAAAEALARQLGIRITVIGVDGRVLGDSEQGSSDMGNQKTRPEVLQALASGRGQSLRPRSKDKNPMLYLALLQRRGPAERIVRIAASLESVERSTSAMRWKILVALGLFSILGVPLAAVIAGPLQLRIKRLSDYARFLGQGQVQPGTLTRGSDDELGELEAALSAMGRRTGERLRELATEKEKAESIVRCMVEGVVVVDSRGGVILLNENAKKMFQLPGSEDFHGASLMQISRHPEMKRLMDDVLSADASGESSTREVRLDEGKWFRVNAVSLINGDARTLGHILVFHDISEIRYLENVRADFVANVSHELRTPLTAIRGYAETLFRTPPSDQAERDQFLQIIYRHSERLGRLIDDLLTLSDLELGKIQLAQQKVIAAELITSSLELFKEHAEKKRIAISQEVEPQGLAILGDADRLQELLINLIDNAIKYTPAAGRIKVSARLVAPPENHPARMVELAVADTGCGIPQKDLPRLTERFYRVDKARSRELGGTGLGLAIVKHITQAHSGFLKIDSQWQNGTTVAVYLRPFGTANGATERDPDGNLGEHDFNSFGS